MDDTLAKALLTVAGVIGGALITALAAAYSARQKTRELELTFKQKLQENYLANARQYIEGVYAPLSIALTRLADAYRDFRSHVVIGSHTIDAKIETAYRRACAQYLATVAELLDRGADAYLTTALDERLQSFTSFIRGSLDATEPVRKITVGYSLSLLGMSAGFTSGASVEARGRWANAANLPSIRFDFLGVGFTYRADELVFAPLASKDFESRIGSDIPVMKYLIKEVTLGSQSHVSK